MVEYECAYLYKAARTIIFAYALCYRIKIQRPLSRSPYVESRDRISRQTRKYIDRRKHDTFNISRGLLTCFWNSEILAFITYFSFTFLS